MEPVTLTSLPVAGIGLAVVAAALLALGNELQSRGVAAVSSKGLGAKQLRKLALNKVWLLGTVSFVLSIIIQIASLSLAPLIVVQPVGVVALVFAAIVTAITTKRMPSKRVVRSILICVSGVAVFVGVAAVVSHQSPIDEVQLITILIVLGVVLLGVAGAVLFFHRPGRRMPPILFVMFGGLLTGFVATLGKTVIVRVQVVLSDRLMFDSATVLTGFCVLAILVAGGLSIYFVQLSHTTSNPEVVVAGLTVIDPFVAVILGITILGEAAGAPIWAVLVFVVAGAVAVSGVFLLSRAQRKDAAEVGETPGTATG